MFDQLLTEITAEMWPFRERLADKEQVRVAMALAAQKRMAAANAQIERRFVEGLGEVVMTLNADLYHRFAALYGYETVNSPDFIRTLLRDNPELRVKSRADAVTLRMHCTDWKEAGKLRNADCGMRIGDTGSADVCTEAAAIEDGELTLPAGRHALQGDPARRSGMRVLHETAPAGESRAVEQEQEKEQEVAVA